MYLNIYITTNNIEATHDHNIIPDNNSYQVKQIFKKKAQWICLLHVVLMLNMCSCFKQ